MKVIKPSATVIVPETPYKHIEKISRICYKSENTITETSAEPFVRRLFNSNHNAMLEHFRFIVEIDEYDYKEILNVNHRKYLTMTDDDHRYIVSASARGFNDMYRTILDDYSEIDVLDILESIIASIVYEYKCEALFDMDLYDISPIEKLTNHVITDFSKLSDKEYNAHAWYSVHFVCDRGVSHELVRHRDASFAQESTRYCNYNKGKYGSEITVIKPIFWEEDSEEYKLWWIDCKHSEETYNSLIKLGATPQEVRSILPNSLKTEIVVTAQVYEWRHIISLRMLGTTGAPHPQMKEVMEMAYNSLPPRMISDAL